MTVESPSFDLLLIDGHALAYRSFYALPDFTGPRGQPTGALYGFIRKLQQLCHAYRPGALAVTFDGGPPVARLRLLPEYKQQRKPMPPPLREQLPFIERFLDLVGIAHLREEGEEADDLLASLAAAAAGQQMRVLLASSDKDLMQLINARVQMLPLGPHDTVLDETGVMAKTGVPPERIADWLALIGDSSDNIPGLPGVGPKTATNWIQQFGGCAEILAHAAELTPVRFRELVRGHEALLRRNLELVRLRTDLAVAPDRWQAWATPDFSARSDPAWTEFSTEFGLHSLLPHAAPTPPPQPAPSPVQGELFPA